jgi:hypothetical protein
MGVLARAACSAGRIRHFTVLLHRIGAVVTAGLRGPDMT